MNRPEGCEGSKECSSCGKMKELELYKKKRGGQREARCRECISAVGSDYYQKNKEVILERQRKRYGTHGRKRKSQDSTRRKRLSTVPGRAVELLRAARRRAKEKGIPCTLTKRWVMDRLRSGVCQETGMAFDMVMAGGRNKLAPSIDRHDLSQGYTPYNCRVVIWAWNCARGQYGTRFLLEMVDAFQGRTGLSEEGSATSLEDDQEPSSSSDTI